MAAHRVGAFAVLIVLSGGHCGDHVDPPLPECAWSDVSFAPEPGSPPVKAWQDPEKRSLADGLSGKFLADICRGQFADNVETTYCSRAITSVCDSSRCPSTDQSKACKEPPQSEKIMNKCRADVLAAFTTNYPACAGFHLCEDNRLVAPETKCH